MGEGLKQMFNEVSSSRAEDDDDLGEISSVSGESDHDSDSDAAADHTTTSPPNNSDHKTLDEFSSLVSQLPIKRGLSKFYKGKSQSFSSFSDVRCVEDLAKKENPCKRKMKTCRSYAGGLDESQQTAAAENNYYYHKKSNIPKKKASRGGVNLASACASSIARTTSSGSSYFSNGKPPPIPMQKNI